MRAIIARPRAAAAAFATALARRGIDAVAAPVLEIAPRAGVDVDGALAGAQAVLLTSANGARALAANTARRDVEIFAVGDATAAAARGAGFRAARSVDGDAAALARFAAARLDAAAGPVVHAAAVHAAGGLAAALARGGFACRRLALYEAVAARALPEAAAAALRGGAADGVALFSPRGAEVFVRLARAAGLADRLAEVDAWCLSAAVARAAGAARWRRAAAAARPRADALRDLIAAAAKPSPGAAAAL